MDRLDRIDRRLFMSDFGRGTLAFAVLGPTVLAACSSNGDVAVLGDDSNETSTVAVDGDTASTADSQSSTAPGGTTQSSSTVEQAEPSSTESAPADGAAPLRWERVVLGSVSAYVLARGSEIAIVDTGFAGSASGIEQALTTLDAAWGDVNNVVLTHMHGDHVGGLPEILDLAASATAWAGEADVARIDSPRAIEAVNDGDEVFGMEIIATPGHTPGHISVLDREAGFLVAGDAMNESSGMILGPNPSFTSDMGTANASVVRLAERKFETVVFGHGDPFEGGASDAVVALAQTLG